jgi:rsbT co-antagonist protein RsbR
MLGYQPDELSDQIDTWQQSIHPDDAHLVNQAFQEYLSGQISKYEIEHRLQHKSGEWRWFLSRGKITMRDDQGKPTRITGTITDIHERKRTEEELRLFQTLAENAPDAIGVAHLESGQITYANPAYCTLLGHGAETIGQSFTEVYAPEEQERLPAIVQEAVEQGVWQGMLTFQRKDGTTFPGLLSGMVLRDTSGQPYAVAAIVRDMSDQIQAEEERAAMQEQIIRAQQAALRELSTPLIPLAEGLVVMPLIGSMDSNRAQQVMETLLEGVAAQRATTAILDITGLQVVDTQVADALVRAARAVRLLGAQVIITGIRPEVAQTLVGMGADLSSIVTHGSLQSGIAFAMGQ